MERFIRLRADLAARWARLDSRLTCVERDAAERGFSCGAETSPESPQPLRFNPILENFLAGERLELGRLASAIHRIDRKVFDCCILCGGEIPARRLRELPYSASCEACSSSYPTSYDEGLRIQHRSLQRSLLALLDILSQIRTQLDRGSDARVEIVAAAVIFSSLHREIPDHFAREEVGGYLSEALVNAPRLTSRAEPLRRQHATFCRALDGLFNAILGAEAHPALFVPVERDVREFAMSLIRHEDAENRLLEIAREEGPTGPPPANPVGASAG
jgi:hypothetical protein